jgi:hypothetical protein
MRLVVLVFALGACGPIVYVNEVTRRADDRVEEAKAAEADKYAPYWWTRAKEFLHKSRELAAHADFQGANRYGRLANEAAENALAEVEIVKKDPSKGPLVEPKTAPAKGDEPPPKADKPLAPAKDDKP